MDYENRTDFRAFDTLICAIDNATPDALRKAIKDCREIYNDTSWKATKRALYRDMAMLLRKHAKR